MRTSAATLVALLVIAGRGHPLPAQEVPVTEHVLPNGMTFLFVPREGAPNVAAGWVAKVGSVNERPGITGTAHLFEHMMFKGTRIVGSRDIAKDLEIIEKLDRLKEELAREEEELQRRARLGEIGDPSDPAARSERHRRLLADFRELLEAQRKIIIKDEFDRIYSSAGASGLNAGTTYDFTIYFINVPSNKLELWFWMESDRLLNPVFREFYSERDVVREERRLRTESTPTGKYLEQFDALFWTSSPYSWPVIGWPSDVEAITREEALEFYDTYYAPQNLTACLVGDVDVEEAGRLAEKYFGRLERGAKEPAVVRTREVPQLAQKRMIAHAPTRPEVILRYHTVPDGHEDEYALVVLGDLLSGLTGRLYRSLVLDQGIANTASAFQRGLKYDGYFELRAVAGEGKDPLDVEKAIAEVLEEIESGTIPERELQKVKNQITATEFRKLRSDFQLLLELLIRDAYRGWETIRTDPEKLLAVTAEDVRRVVAKYFRPEDRNALIFYTEEASGETSGGEERPASAPPDSGKKDGENEEPPGAPAPPDGEGAES